MKTLDAEEIFVQTRRWVQSVVVECNFCPFAQREYERDSIRYVVCDEAKLESCLEKVIDECIFLDSDDETETTLIIFSKAFSSFEDFLICLELAERLLTKQAYQGIYQLASFHPEYCFSGSDNDDAANYTNRSPYPMLQLLRESSVEKALDYYTEAESIPVRNMAYARKAGLDVMKARLERCRRD